MSFINGNRVLKTMRVAYLDLDSVYPVGSIYMSVNNTNPQILFGGTWEQIQDKFLLASGSTYLAGSTGGNATHKHDLTNAYAKVDFRSNRLNLYRKTTASWTGNVKTSSDILTDGDGYGGNQSVELGGKTDSGDNMPPYLAVYIWKRTA